MSASFGRYAPKDKRYGDWAFRTIHHKADRRGIAEKVCFIRRNSGSQEAREFLNYLHWLGTYPVIGSARWNCKYGKPIEE